ncbi:MAG TPA: glycerol-3-phosphate 1-O-acyltransferase PlsB [Rhodocyclaceae bacterium]|nr:glycerol-3-phosphate 1-O-acyltransferase PlsB [Rhodocyclaceae bacterium]
MFHSLDFAGWLLPLGRRLLYAWVRTRVFPESLEELGLDPARPVCYVLQNRQFSNLLVLAEETRRTGMPLAEAAFAGGPVRARRSFFFLTRPQRLVASAKDRYGHSPLLQRIVAAGIADPGLDVQLVPVTILWGRAPGKQDSILKALFSEAWRPPGHLRQFMAVLLHGRQTLVRFNAPLSLRETLAGEPDEARALRKLSRVLRVHFRRQREMAIGPDFSHRNTQIENLLAAEPVRRAVVEEAASRGISIQEAQMRARSFALEIASDYNYGVIRALEIFLDWVWNRIYDGVEVRNFDTVTRIAPDHGIVYVPCHRSHVDYLLLSFVIFRRGLMPPHIAAGANLNLPVVGPLLRRGGAFFLRRSFKGEPLYAIVFDEYLHLMLAHGFPIEYFIEGGRSRSGRMLPPKAGILGMTIRSFLRSHERPLVFVPVYIGYEKLVEGDSYQRELAGRPKSGESLWGVLATVRDLRRYFGRAHVNFGRPLDLGEALGRVYPEWQNESDPRATWVREAIHEVAVQLARRINEAAVVNPINMAALVLLATPKQAVDEATLGRMVGHYGALLAIDGEPVPAVNGTEAAALPIAGNGGAPAPAEAKTVDQALRLGILERITHPLGDILRVPAGQGAYLAYFRNNVLHRVALPALVACLLAHNPRLPRSRVESTVAGLYRLLRAELFLPWEPADLPPVLARLLALLADRGLVRVDGDGLAAPAPGSREFHELAMLGETLRPTLERHFLTLLLLRRHGSGRVTRQTLVDTSHLVGQRMGLLYEFDSPEFAEKSLFAGVIQNLVEESLLREDEDGTLHFDEGLTAPAADAELLLGEEVRQTLRRVAESPQSDDRR